MTSTAGKIPIRARQSGFTYIMMLIAVVIVGIMASVATMDMARVMREARESELLFRGLAYQNAIREYYAAGARIGRPDEYPMTLRALLRDPRFLGRRRYLRALYRDPMGHGKHAWVLIRAPGGGIAGVASASHARPLKTHFPSGLESFQRAKTYAQWIFVYEPHPGLPSASLLKH